LWERLFSPKREEIKRQAQSRTELFKASRRVLRPGISAASVAQSLIDNICDVIICSGAAITSATGFPVNFSFTAPHKLFVTRAKWETVMKKGMFLLAMCFISINIAADGQVQRSRRNANKRTAPATASGAMPSPRIKLVAEYENINDNAENKYLDNFAVRLQEDPRTHTGLIVVHGGFNDPPGSPYSTAERSKEYLVEDRKIDANRVIVKVKPRSRRKAHIYLYLVPPGAEIPKTLQ
jgi:hypothetical protein